MAFAGGAFCLAGCTLEAPDDTSFAAQGNRETPVGADRSATGFGGIFSSRRNAPPEDAKALSKARLAKGDIVLEGPPGWCIEPRSLKAHRKDNFASLAGCHALTQGRTGTPVMAGIVTVTISARRPAGDVTTSDALAQAVAGEPILAQTEREGVALVHLRPRQAATETGPGEPHWRGVFVHGARIVALAAYGPQDGAVSGAEGGRLLSAIAARIRDLSPDPAAGGTPVAARRPATAGGGILGRLLNRTVSE